MSYVLQFVIALHVSLVVAFSQAAPTRFEELVRQFDYDSKASLDVREISRNERSGITIVDLSYASPRGGRVPAYLVVPTGNGPFAAILFGHWMMPGSPLRNRNEFLDEAVALAQAGAMSLLIDATLVRPGFVEEKGEMRAQKQSANASLQQVIDFRRAVDLLIARPDVDRKRIAYVGHSFDAHVGGILSAVEKRIGSFVLMAGVFADEEFVLQSDNPRMRKVRQRIGEETLRRFFRQYAFDDPVFFVSHSAPAAVFLQFGRHDEGISEKSARHYYDLFAEPKKIEFYEAGHALDSAARLDRVQWLTERLALREVNKAELARVPELK